MSHYYTCDNGHHTATEHPITACPFRPHGHNCTAPIHPTTATGRPRNTTKTDPR